jgi:gluconate 2-dehydrogenase gamma chain
VLDDPVGRRAFLAASGAAFASAWLAADPAAVRASLLHAAQAASLSASGPPPPWEVLTAEDAADVDAIAAQIIPTDDLPGAREAGAVYFIDHALATWGAEQRAPFMAGLRDLNREARRRWPDAGRFATLPAERQVALLQAVEGTPFFQAIRFATVAATFTNPSWGGNRGKVGWRILGFDDRFVWQAPFGDYDAGP